MASNPAIVISAYNRPASLSRLLASVANAVYNTGNIDLVISIDKSGDNDVLLMAEAFEWQHGQKKIIIHNEHLGLKKHILSCGSLTHTYGAIILLEDDLLVSPYFYSYAQQAQSYYKSDKKIAGISLYNYQVAESCFYPFKAIDDGTGVYFMQVASSWGQLWTKEQWTAFTDWFALNPGLTGNAVIPDYIKEWGQHSWKKHFIHYLIDTGTYFVFPRLSLTTNFEDAGTNASTKNIFQVPLQLSAQDYNFAALEKSAAVYDAWFELLPACLNTYNEKLKAYDYTVDLYGAKDAGSLKCNYLLTTKKGNNPLLTFGMALFPFENNVALKQPGHKIGLFQVKGNELKPVKLGIYNVLEAQKKEDESGISIIIPFENNDEASLKTTLASIAGQNFKNKECIIASNNALSSALKKMISAFDFVVKNILPEQAATTEGLIEAGFKNAGKGILTWVMPGSTFTAGALEKIALIFRSNLNVSWARGIDEAFDNGKACNNLNVRKYRLTAGEAYRRLQKGNLNISTEQDFFRKHCFDNLPGNHFSFTGLFFSLISSYPLIIVVSKLGHKNTACPEISRDERHSLLAEYAHLGQKNKLSVNVIDGILQKFFVNTGISRWFYTSAHNFPDVLRYDAIHNTFYFSKC